MCKLLSEYYDILLLYITCDKDQLNRLKQYVNVEKYNDNKQYECDICLLASSWGGYPDSVTASSGRYIQMIHADYSVLAKTGWLYKPFKKTTEHIAVGEHVANTFKEYYNIDAKIVHNILDELQPIKRKLRLISATRLSNEKGYNRMIKLANTLKENNIRFEWVIFTDLKQYNVKPIQLDEVIFKQSTLDIFPHIVDADYGVQLSDTEGYSYFVNECLQYGTPMITTNFQSAYESVIDGYNGYILDMELSNLDIDKLVNNIPKDFIYTPKTSINTWKNILGKSNTKTILNNTKDTMTVRITRNYRDNSLNRMVKANEIFELPIDKAIYLINKCVAKEI